MNFDELQVEFGNNGYCLTKLINQTQFTKAFVFDNGIKYCLTWYVTNWKHEVYGDKTTYNCMFITGERIHVSIDSDTLNILETEDKAKQLYNTKLFKPFQII